MGDTSAAVFGVLFVCTANEGRSAIAEGLFRARLRPQALICAVSVGSAGTRASDVPVSAVVAAALVPYHVDLTGHRSRRLTAALIDAAGLVVAMARSHAHAVAALVPTAEARTFTLRELVRAVETAGPRPASEPVGEYLARLRPASEPPAWADDRRGSAGPPLDIDDPYGQPLGVLVATTAEIHHLLGRLLANVWPKAGGAPNREQDDVQTEGR